MAKNDFKAVCKRVRELLEVIKKQRNDTVMMSTIKSTGVNAQVLSDIYRGADLKISDAQIKALCKCATNINEEYMLTGKGSIYGDSKVDVYDDDDDDVVVAPEVCDDDEEDVDVAPEVCDDDNEPADADRAFNFEQTEETASEPTDAPRTAKDKFFADIEEYGAKPTKNMKSYIAMGDDGNMHAFMEEYKDKQYAHCTYDGFPSDDTLIKEEYYEDDIKKYTLTYSMSFTANIELEGTSEDDVREQFKHLTLLDLVNMENKDYNKAIVKVTRK